VRGFPFGAPYSIVEKRAERLQRLAQCLGDERASVLTPDIGAIAYTTDLLIIDLIGLGDAYIARRDPTAAELADYVLSERRPDIISAHYPFLYGLDTDPRWQRDYVSAVIERDSFGHLLEGIFVRRKLAAGEGHCLAVAP
jgi:hypothetical protein